LCQGLEGSCSSNHEQVGQRPSVLMMMPAVHQAVLSADDAQRFQCLLAEHLDLTGSTYYQLSRSSGVKELCSSR
jgi:hypothetical protein